MLESLMSVDLYKRRTCSVCVRAAHVCSAAIEYWCKLPLHSLLESKLSGTES
jgi:hypothetical protein